MSHSRKGSTSSQSAEKRLLSVDEEENYYDDDDELISPSKPRDQSSSQTRNSAGNLSHFSLVDLDDEEPRTSIASQNEPISPRPASSSSHHQQDASTPTNPSSNHFPSFSSYLPSDFESEMSDAESIFSASRSEGRSGLSVEGIDKTQLVTLIVRLREKVSSIYLFKNILRV